MTARPAGAAAGPPGGTADGDPPVKLLADEKLHRAIVRSLLRCLPHLWGLPSRYSLMVVS